MKKLSLTQAVFCSLSFQHLIACRNKSIDVEPVETEAILTDNDYDGFTNDVDCDDASPLVNPDAIESCDGIDNNCDGQVDEGVRLTFYQDLDQDGFGDGEQSVEACQLPAGFVPLGNDCDDNDPAIYRGALEICNDIDDDCDGEIDEDLLIGLFYDADGDGYGDPTRPSEDCTGGNGYVYYGTDCDDTDPEIRPYQEEWCDGIDNDCNGIIDDGTTLTFYQDQDGDGFGLSTNTIQACVPPEGYVSVMGDCDDTDSTQYPNADEICNQEDDDCDGDIDNNPINPPTWYYDIDGDGFGSSFIQNHECTPPQGFITDNTDCDDTNTTIFPGAPEYCNDVDNNCDGQIDNNAIDAQTWYADIDRDDFGNANEILIQCHQPFDYILVAGDCDDSNDDIYPDAPEYCNGIDDNCNGIDDDNTIDSFDYYLDADGDGYGDIDFLLQECLPPSGYVLNSDDCDDDDPNIHPNAQELCDGLDQNCNGINFYEEDINGNGLLACEESVWFRNSQSNPTNPNGAFSQAAGLLQDLGLTINQYNHANNFITLSLLQNYGLFVHHGANPDGAIRAYTNAEAGALAAWVHNGGRFLYIGYNSNNNCDIADSLPAPFGLTCIVNNNNWSGTATTINTHPLTDGLADVGGQGGDSFSVSLPTEALIYNNNEIFVSAAQYGEGKIVIVANEMPFYNSGYTYSINYGDNAQMVENIWTWLIE